MSLDRQDLLNLSIDVYIYSCACSATDIINVGHLARKVEKHLYYEEFFTFYPFVLVYTIMNYN